MYDPMVLFSPKPRGIGMFREMGHHMGCVGRNCPMFRCGSADAARLANHLDQVHDIDKEQRAKWLKFGKIGIKPLFHSSQKSTCSECFQIW